MRDWRVAVVEDDRDVGAVHCRYISERPGFFVVGAATDGPAAARLIETQKPDLVVLDLGLPGKSGLALLKEIRSAESLPPEVIVVTAHGDVRVVNACVRLGVLDYLVKPFALARLSQALAAFVHRMQAVEDRATLDQQSIDDFRVVSGGGSQSLPQGIMDDRLTRVRSVLGATGSGGLTADEVAAPAGIARVTARRYLEYLVEQGECEVEAIPRGLGRPSKVYRAVSTVQDPSQD